MLLARDAHKDLLYCLRSFDSVLLTGPRQAGKSTLARKIASEWDGGVRYLDLEQFAARRLLDDPFDYFSRHADKLIVLDEIHRVPEIFPELRGQIDERRRMDGKGGKFLFLGSVSIDLLHQSSESLAGRISYVELTPFTWHEISSQRNLSENSPNHELDRLWLQGGFPPSYLHDSESLKWRSDFIRTYLERDISQFGLRVDTDRMDRFWRMIACDQGELFNKQRYARSLDVSGKTIYRYSDILEKTLMVRVLQPWYFNVDKRLVKSPRLYVRDSGILHALLDLRSIDHLRSHSVAGKSWEGFVIENVISAAGSWTRPYFYRTSAGAEIDLVLEFSLDKIWAIEIKLSSAPSIDRGFHNAADDIKAERRILVHRGKGRFPMRHGVEAMTLLDVMNEVSMAAKI